MYVNKIMGALLAVALIILALPTAAGIVFGTGGHHGGGHGEEKPIMERVSENYAYYLPISEGVGAAAAEEVFDLGAAEVARDDTGDRTATGQNGIGHHAHQANVTAAIDQTPVCLCYHRAEFMGETAECRVVAHTGTTEDTNGCWPGHDDHHL